jgi:hypothetical protein
MTSHKAVYRNRPLLLTISIHAGICYGSAMGNQTYQKRQKELARSQKKKDKFARRIQRKTEKVKGGPPLEDDPMTGDRMTSDPSMQGSPAV